MEDEEEEKQKDEDEDYKNAVSSEMVKWYGYRIIASPEDLAIIRNVFRGISLKDIIIF